MKEIKFYDTRDIYRIIRGTSLRGLGIKEKEFISVVSSINQKIADAILDGDIVQLPCSMGCILPIEEDTLYMKNGKLIINKPVDWKKTIELWEIDPETRRNGVKVRHDLDKRYKIIYSKKGTAYRNKYYIHFKPLKSLFKSLLDRVSDGSTVCYKG